MSALIQKYYLVKVVSTITAQNSFYKMVIDYNDHTNYTGFLDILYVMMNTEGNHYLQV